MSRINFKHAAAVLALLGASLAAPLTAVAQSAPTPAPQTKLSDYIIGPEDILTIFVRDLPEASGDFMVRTDGKIQVPVAGEIQASGLKVEDLQKKLVELLKKELIQPDVTVNVKQMHMNRIYVLGEVAHPLLYDMKPGWRLTELIAAAGGLNGLPERLTAVIYRQDSQNIKVSMKDLFIDGKDEANIPLQPGDVVNIRGEATIRVNVVGEVMRPGFYDIFDGQGAAEAIAAAGGQRDDAKMSGAVVTRGDGKLKVNLYEAILNANPDENLKLKTGDTLYVPKLVARVSVVGTVNRPGSIMIPDGRDYTVTQAISDAGGPASQAKLDGIIVVRQGEDGKVQQFPIDYKKITAAKSGHPDFELQDRDVIFIPQSGRPNVSQISGFGNLWFIARAIFGIK